ncbi:nuclear transport factor 2 family protein [Gordonia humi]|uniref:Uncharacterized protein (TIGR02246 family) n=1 Tax=Gordonia humi TaxID=686429 RepID=A0A840EXE8_9ACTN|nr:nuclear transport factor 2 family protein [Gordonia humi]MBB4133599.1 uncharacterized protein (TIGR02246 family) [Gordonia humi]
MNDAARIVATGEDARFQAMIDGDVDAFARLCHPDLVYTHSSGVTDTLDEYLAKVREGFYVYHRVDHPIHDIRIVDDVALVIGEMNADITANGVDKSMRNASLAVWKQVDGEWLLLAFQGTPVPVV